MTRTMRRVMLAVLLLMGIGLASCNFSPVNEAPSPTAGVTVTLTVTASLTPAPPTATQIPANLITPANTPTPVTPSATPTITNTPGPIEHVLQADDQLIAVVQEYGHTSLAVLDLVVTMNANITNSDILPPPGSVILIPRPTSTPTPIGGELTATVVAENPVTPTPPLLTMVHTVEDGQTMAGIAVQYNTTLQVMRNLNPQVSWLGCDFSVASGGEECNPLLVVGEELTVPMPTPTPTLSPTPSGSETPTPSPTFGPVRLLWPAPGNIVAGGPLVLRWVSSGALQPDEMYQVTVLDSTAGVRYTDFTRSTILELPSNLVPTDDAAHHVTWRVDVVRVGSDNIAFAVGATGEERPFQWQAAQ